MMNEKEIGQVCTLLHCGGYTANVVPDRVRTDATPERVIAFFTYDPESGYTAVLTGVGIVTLTIDGASCVMECSVEQ